MFLLRRFLSILAIRSASSLSTTSSSSSSLGKESSALDVVRTLNRNDAFAPYVRNGGNAVVTGGSSGIGAVSVEALALVGLRVTSLVRDVEAGERARDAIPNADARERVRVVRCDLADLSSVEAAARDVVARDASVDVLLLNAGVMATPTRTDTAQGLELQFGTNHVGHHMLARCLLPSMSRDGGRVVTVASTAHTMGDVDFTDLNYDGGQRRYSPWGAYGQSKLANILFAKGLQDRLRSEKDDEGSITSVSLHPGVIATNLWKSGVPGFIRPFIRPVVNIFSDKTTEQGAATNVYCSLVESCALSGGGYYSDCQAATPNESGQDKDRKLRDKLWDETERIIREAGFNLPETLL